MKNILKLILLSLFLFISSFIYAQDDFKVVKIDNINYPQIELYVKTDNGIDPKEFSVYENNKKIEFISDTILQKDLKKERSILFVICEKPDPEFKNALIKTIRTFTETDKINIAVILDGDTINNVIHYVSPEFSNNHSFFINVLEQKILNNISYDLSRKSNRIAVSIEKKMFEKQDAFSSKGIIFLINDLMLKQEPCSNILKDVSIPTYVLLTKEPVESSQRELIDLCTKTGGIYTISDQNEIENYLNLYLEDISLNINKTKTELYRIRFISKQTQNKNILKINYKDQSKHYIFIKPQKDILNVREKGLIILSGFLIIILFIIVYRGKGKKNKETVFIKDIKENKEILSGPIKPIEINIKTKGFNKTYFFEKHIIRIGRSSDNDIIIPDRTVSGTHAVINKEGENYMIQDIGSTNGVMVNQKKVKKAKLKSRDKIKLGSAILILRIP